MVYVVKRLFCILFVFAMLITSAISEEIEPDPIVGCWYADIELDGEIVLDGYEDYTRFLVVLAFESSGEISRFEVDYNGKIMDTSGPSVVGKWKKTKDGEYSLSIIALGTEKAYIINNVLHAMAIVKDVYYCFHKMIPFDWYNDLYSK